MPNIIKLIPFYPKESSQEVIDAFYREELFYNVTGTLQTLVRCTDIKDGTTVKISYIRSLKDFTFGHPDLRDLVYSVQFVVDKSKIAEVTYI